jgi:hypothetical protein
MRRKMLGLTLSGIAGSALAVDRVNLDNRTRTRTARFETPQRDPANAIPAETLGRAKGIVLPDRVKAGVEFAYQGGSITFDGTDKLLYYSQTLTASDILFRGKAKPTDAMLGLADQIAADSGLARN